MSSRFVALTLFSTVACGSLFAQGRPVTVLIPTTQPSTSQPPAGPGTAALGSPGVFVSGKLAVADGGTVPPNVVIAKLCGNKREALGFADSKGNFSVKLSGNSLAALVDASDDNRGALGRGPIAMRDQGGANLLGCELLASFPGYRSETINISSRRSLDNPDVGTLLLHRLGSGTGTMVSQTTLLAPKPALKAYEHAMSDMRKSNVESARKNLEKAVDVYPKFASAWYELGHLLVHTDPAAAKSDLDKAVEADPKYALPYSDLTILAYRKENWVETIRISDLGLRLDSAGSPALYFFNAAAHFRLRNYEEAERKARDAIKIDYSHALPKAPQLLAYILAARHDYPGAAEQMRVYLASAPPDADVVRSELAHIESALHNAKTP